VAGRILLHSVLFHLAGYVPLPNDEDREAAVAWFQSGRCAIRIRTSDCKASVMRAQAFFRTRQQGGESDQG
jgi:hypothetical protein